MSDLSFLDFVVNRLFMKLFKTSNIDVVKCCQDHFGFDLPSVSWSKRVKKFEAKFHVYDSEIKLCISSEPFQLVPVPETSVRRAVAAATRRREERLPLIFAACGARGSRRCAPVAVDIEDAPAPTNSRAPAAR